MFSNARRRRILIVDDQPQILQLYSRVLDRAGYDTQTALDAERALHMIQVAAPDGVFVDLRMPFINGVGLLYRLRFLYPDLPAAIITGESNLNGETAKEVATLGAALHFKPLSNTEVEQVASELLARPARFGAGSVPAVR